MGLFDPQYETLIWTDVRHAELVRKVCKLTEGVSVIGVGGPNKADLVDLSGRLAAGTAGDDLRQMLVDLQPAYVLLATADGVKREDIALALENGADVISLEPPGGKATESPLPKTKKQIDRPGRFALSPLLRLSPAWLSAADPQQALGEIASFSIVNLTPPDGSSLFARLHDSLDLVIALMGTPGLIHASLYAASSNSFDDPRQLTGHLTVNLIFASGASGVIYVSDQAAVWSRRLTMIGDAGQITLSDTQYRLFSKTGERLDDALGDPAPGDPAELIARQFRRMIDHAGPLSDAGPIGSPQQLSRILACCHAAMLSCRNGQAEDVGRFLHMQGV